MAKPARALPIMQGGSPSSSLPFSPSRETGTLYNEGAISNDMSDFNGLDVPCHCNFISPYGSFVSCGGIYDWWCNNAYNVQTFVLVSLAWKRENALNDFLNKTRKACGRLSIDYMQVRTSEPLDAVLAKFLDTRMSLPKLRT